MNIRVGGIAITPPVYGASGGVSAGLQLMERIATMVETRMMVMGEENKQENRGELKIDFQRAYPSAQVLSGLMPGKVKSLLWKADFGQWLDRYKPHIVHLHNPHPPGAMLSAARECLERNIPYVISTHGFVEYDNYTKGYGASLWQKPLLDYVVRSPLVYVARNAAKIFMLSPQEVDIYTRMGVQADKLEVVTNGINPDYLDTMTNEDVTQLLERFDIPDTMPVVFFVGNHTTNKGLDVLLQAQRKIRNRVQFVVGGGIGNAEKHRKMLSDAGLDPENCDTIFTGFLSDVELKAMYSRCDMFVFPSRADTLPLVILEAMSTGKAVISTKVGGIPYQVTADSGILIEPGNVNELVEAINKLADDPDLRLAMGQNGKNRARELFDWNVSAEKSLSLYREILAG